MRVWGGWLGRCVWGRGVGGMVVWKGARCPGVGGEWVGWVSGCDVGGKGGREEGLRDGLGVGVGGKEAEAETSPGRLAKPETLTGDQVGAKDIRKRI